MNKEIHIVCETFNELSDLTDVFMKHKLSGSLTYGKVNPSGLDFEMSVFEFDYGVLICSR